MSRSILMFQNHINILCVILSIHLIWKEMEAMRKFWGWKICLVYACFFKHLSLIMLITFMHIKKECKHEQFVNADWCVGIFAPVTFCNQQNTLCSVRNLLLNTWRISIRRIQEDLKKSVKRFQLQETRLASVKQLI